MPTPIRIRGKRTAAEAGSSSHKRPRQARKLVEAPMKHRPRLQDLPVELLQDIFCYGTNLRLPLVCSGLYHALTSHSVKTRLVFRMFSAQNTIEICAGDFESGAQWLYHLNHVWPGLKSCVVTDGNAAKLQSAVLRQKWFTYEFLRECQLKHVTRAAHNELRKFLDNDSKTVLEASLREVDERLRSNIEWGAYSPHFVHGPQTRRRWLRRNAFHGGSDKYVPFSRFQRADGESLAVFLPAVLGLNAQLAIWREGPSIAKGEVIRYTFPALQAKCRIPSKLQHGPWTQQKGHLLTQLVYGITAAGGIPQLLSPTSTDSDIAADGFSDAIRERCIPWIRLFLARTSEEHQLALGLVLCLAEDDIEGVTRPDPDDPSVFSTEHNDPRLRLDATGPWQTINEIPEGVIDKYEPDQVKKKHFEVILHEAPVGDFAPSLFMWMFMQTSMTARERKEIYSMVIRARVYVDDPSRVKMIEEIEMDVAQLVETHIERWDDEPHKLWQETYTPHRYRENGGKPFL